MTNDLRQNSNNDSGDMQIDRLLGAFRDIEPPPRPSDETVIEQLREMPPRRWSRTSSIVERIRKMPPMIRYGMAACVAVVTVLLGVDWGAGNPAFADVNEAISEQGTVRIQVEIEVQMPTGKHTEKRLLYASTKPLRLRTESADGNIEILDVAVGKRLLIDPKNKIATLHILPKPGDKAPDSLLEALQLHFPADGQVDAEREQLNGREVVVYKTERATLNNKSRIQETMWVDPTTMLPLKTQGEIVSPDPKMSQTFSRVVMSDFQWNPSDARKKDFFSTEPPAMFVLKTVDTTRQPQDSASPPRE